MAELRIRTPNKISEDLATAINDIVPGFRGIHPVTKAGTNTIICGRLTHRMVLDVLEQKGEVNPKVCGQFVVDRGTLRPIHYRDPKIRARRNWFFEPSLDKSTPLQEVPTVIDYRDRIYRSKLELLDQPVAEWLDCILQLTADALNDEFEEAQRQLLSGIASGDIKREKIKPYHLVTFTGNAENRDIRVSLSPVSGIFRDLSSAMWGIIHAEVDHARNGSMTSSRSVRYEEQWKESLRTIVGDREIMERFEKLAKE
jgi:hypothetical protein